MKNKNKILDTIGIFLISLFLIAPLIMTLVYSLFRDFTGIIPKGFTFQFYTDLFTTTGIVAVLLRTALISIIPVVITLIVMLLAFYGIERYYPQVDKYLNFITKIPYGIQGIIMGASLIVLYASSDNFYGNRFFLLICAYIVFIFPYMYQGIKSALSTIEIQPILEAAEILGANPLISYWTIIVPSVLPGLVSTMLLCSGLLFADFVLVNMLAGSYYQTLGIFLNRMLFKSGPTASAISTIMGIVMFSMSFFVNYFNRKQKSQSTTEE